LDQLVRDAIIVNIKIHCVITDVHIIINACIRIVECILINSTVAVVEITTCWEINLVHHISHVVVVNLINIACWNIHGIPWNVHRIYVVVEIHLILIEVIHVILVIWNILVPLILVIALFRIWVIVITSCWNVIAIIISCLS